MQQICFRPILLVLTMFLVIHTYNSFDLKCPDAVHWKQRALGKCGPPNETEKYYCLYDGLYGNYTEGCTGPDWDRRGQKRIISGYFTRGNCTKMRYQPFDFLTAGNSDCVYTKSLCSEEGQITSNHGLGYNDRTCRCDYTRGYNYIESPKDLCNCRPAIEDCSCVQKEFRLLHDLKELDLKCANTNVEDHSDNQNTLPNPMTVIQNNSQFLTIRRDGIVLLATVMVLVTTLICILWILLVVTYKALRLSDSKESLSFQVKFNKHNIDQTQDLEKGYSSDEDSSSDESGIEKLMGFFTDEEINYLRSVHLIFGVVCSVVRIVFNGENNLYKLRQSLNQNIAKFSWSEVCSSKQVYTTSSNLFPLLNDTKIAALLRRIQYYRTLIVDAVDGRIRDTKFQSYWKEIGQMTLRLASKHLDKINQNKTLRDQLLALSPIKVDDIKLKRFIRITERIPKLIFQQIIKEYCSEKYKNESLNQLLIAEKHSLLHKRKRQSYCCCCDNKTFSYIISDELWNTLYRYDETKKLAHTCKRKKRCILRYENNIDFDIDEANTVMMNDLVLNTSLLRYVVMNMFKEGFQPFLEKSKHVIFHAVESFGDIQCCYFNAARSCLKVKTLLTRHEWDKLYTRKNQTICTAEQCCCGFSVKDSLNTESIDDVLFFKIMSVAGPFHVFGETKFNPINTFLCWNGKSDKYIDAINDLLEAVKDKKFVQNLKCELDASQSLTGVNEQGHVAKWILKNKSVEKATSKPQNTIVILLQDKGKLATLEVAVSKKAQIFLSGEGTIPWTHEETNFLRLYHMLIQILCPVLRTKFDYHISAELEKIIAEIYCKDLEENHKMEVNHSNSAKDAFKEPLQLTSVQRNRLFLSKHATSENLDLALMIIILEKYRNASKTLKDDEQLYNCLEAIKDVRKKITQSCNGILTNDEFARYWDILSEVVIYLGGEGYEQLLLDLKTRRIPQDDE